MAINREPREDLMREATVYTRRLIIRDLQDRVAIFVGLRAGGGWSIYFGEEPVYQFNSEGKLRRIHIAEQNYAADGGKMFLLERLQTGGRVELQKTYSANSERKILDDCLTRLVELAELIHNKQFELVDIFPAEDIELVALLPHLLQTATKDLQIAMTSSA